MLMNYNIYFVANSVAHR